ncbi:MAG TPA: ABC transporter substrate-binding protein [Phycisphaerae bacterium]|nr:ABC transporter substrate-binding protein [Phycisphaerae bacterium]
MKKLISLACVLVVGLAAAFIWRASVSREAETITVARCVGYCNLPLLLASEQAQGSARAKNGVHITLKYIGNPADHAVALASAGGPIASVTPFTNVAAAYGSGKPLRIIAGSGMNGLALVGRADIHDLTSLKGRKIGTYRGDTLEALAYGTLEQAGLVGQVELIYFTDPFESLTALRSGKVDAITHVEPFVSQLVSEGMNRLATGEGLWHTDHPDCVLVTTESHIRNDRVVLKALIRQMVQAQHDIESDLSTVSQRIAQPFYKMPPEELMKAVQSQFPAIDIRGLKGFVIAKSQFLVKLGYIPAPADDRLFDFSLLEEVIKENPELFATLKKKYGTVP